MNVRELMTADPEACTPDDTLDIAADIMRRRRCGLVPVVDGQATKQVLGVLTDRDIMLYLTRTNAPAHDVRVEACMTRNPTVIAPNADLTEAAQVMEQLAVHRLPVVEHGRLVGVLSLKDIAWRANREWAQVGAHVAEQQMKEILEAIAATEVTKTG